MIAAANVCRLLRAGRSIVICVRRPAAAASASLAGACNTPSGAFCCSSVSRCRCCSRGACHRPLGAVGDAGRSRSGGRYGTSRRNSPAVVPFSLDLLDAAVLVWMAGFACRLLWLTAGHGAPAQVTARGERRGATASTTSRDLIGVFPAVRWSSDVRHPVTFGLIRPVVASAGCPEVGRPRRAVAVIAHELHHVRRRDWGWVVVEELIRSVFWFHPAMWWLISRVQLARETVVDELSILVDQRAPRVPGRAAGVRGRHGIRLNAGVLRAPPPVPPRDAAVKGGRHVFDPRRSRFVCAGDGARLRSMGRHAGLPAAVEPGGSGTHAAARSQDTRRVSPHRPAGTGTRRIRTFPFPRERNWT